VKDIHQAHLDDGKRKEGSARKEKSEPLPKCCPECRAVLSYKARECSACGARIVAITEVHEVEGELVELGSRRSGKRQTPAIDKEQFYAELKWIQSHKGYRSGWCWNQYRDRFRGERSPKWFSPGLGRFHPAQSHRINCAKLAQNPKGGGQRAATAPQRGILGSPSRKSAARGPLPPCLTK
jgi:hypothetical protein